MRGLKVLVFVLGASSLGSEIAAARLLAPYFGESTIIWANTIAVVLIAIAIGNWLGGKFADRDPSIEKLRKLALIAAVILAVIPLAAAPFLNLSTTAFEDVSAGAFIGSLSGMLVLIAAPLVLVGAVTPWAAKLGIKTVDQAGSTAGALYAISTVGSLTGTFLAALLLIPNVDTQRTFMVFALAIAIVAAAGLKPKSWLAPALIAALIALPSGVTKPSTPGEKLLAEVETSYQYARVLERTAGINKGTRVLELNEGQAIHSIWRRDTVLTGDYWDSFQVLPFASLPREQTAPKRIAMLGNAGGTIARASLALFPDVQFDGAEIDPEVTKLGRRWLGMPSSPRLRVYNRDARPFLRQNNKRYDLIGVDAYRQPYIPFYLATKEFFKLVAEHLTANGVVVVNVGHPEGSSKLERTLAATIHAALPNVWRYPVAPTNTMLVASNAKISPEQLKAAVPELPAQIRPIAEQAAQNLSPADTTGTVFTDDKAPVEWLIDGSLFNYIAGQ